MLEYMYSATVRDGKIVDASTETSPERAILGNRVAMALREIFP